MIPYQNPTASLYRAIVRKKKLAPEPDFLLDIELEEILEESYPMIIRKVAEFIEAYNAWYKFHADLECSGKQGQLNSAEQQTLSHLINTKDRIRKELLEL